MPRYAQHVGTRTEVRGVKCRSWYCPHCAEQKGRVLRRRLRERIRHWQSVLLVTLTVDPENWGYDAAAADQHVADKRAISELIRALHRRGFLHSKEYFYVREFQQNGMAHYHVIVHASFIPWSDLSAIWQRFGKGLWARAGRTPPDHGCEMGFCSVNKTKLKNADHAVNYVTKYLVKPPKDPYPDWVLNSQRVVQRYNASRGLLTPPEDEGDPCDGCGDFVPEGTDPPPQCGEGCFCEACRGELVEEFAPEMKTTILQRSAKCCARGVIMEVEEWMQPGGEIKERRRFIEPLDVDFQSAAYVLGLPIDPERRSFEVTIEALALLKSRGTPQELERPKEAAPEALAT